MIFVYIGVIVAMFGGATGLFVYGNRLSKRIADSKFPHEYAHGVKGAGHNPYGKGMVNLALECGITEASAYFKRPRPEVALLLSDFRIKWVLETPGKHAGELRGAVAYIPTLPSFIRDTSLFHEMFHFLHEKAVGHADPNHESDLFTKGEDAARQRMRGL